MRKKKIWMLVLILALASISFGCAGKSKVTSAYNIMNAVTATYNAAPPVYSELQKTGVISKAEYNAVLVPFDKQAHDGIALAWDALIAFKANAGPWSDYKAKADALLALFQSAIDPSSELGKILVNPKLKATLDAVIALLQEVK